MVTDQQSVSRFSVLQYQRRLAIAGKFRVAYGHTADGVWDVSRWPRIAYGAEHVLYKIQMLHAGSLDCLNCKIPSRLYSSSLMRLWKCFDSTSSKPVTTRL